MKRLRAPKVFAVMQAKEFAVLWSDGSELCLEAERQLAIHGIIADITPFPPLYDDYQPLLLVNQASYKGVDEIRYYCEVVNAYPELAGHQIGYDVPEPPNMKRTRPPHSVPPCCHW